MMATTTAEEAKKWEEQHGKKEKEKEKSQRPRERKGCLNPPSVEREYKTYYKRARSITATVSKRKRKSTRRVTVKKAKKTKPRLSITVENDNPNTRAIESPITVGGGLVPEEVEQALNAGAGVVAVQNDEDSEDDVDADSSVQENNPDVEGIKASIDVTEKMKVEKHICGSCNGVGECIQRHVLTTDDGKVITYTTASEYLPDDGTLEKKIEEARNKCDAAAVPVVDDEDEDEDDEEKKDEVASLIAPAK
jgi:hypothetical protein